MDLFDEDRNISADYAFHVYDTHGIRPHLLEKQVNENLVVD